MKDSTFFKVCLFFIILSGAILRFYNYAGFSLSNDELSALNRLQFNNLHDLIENGIKPDFHPPGVQLFLYFWTKLAGFSEMAVRFPFVISGILSIILLYLLGKKWFNEYTGLLSAAALACLQFPILYSQIARPYSFGLFFTLCVAYILSLLIDHYRKNEKPGWIIYTGFILSVSACMYTHYFSMITAGIIIMIGFILVPGKNKIHYLFCGIPILLLYIPAIPVFLFQMKTGGLGGADGWLGKPGSDFLLKYLQYAFNDSIFILLLFSAAFIFSFLFFRKKNQFTRFHIISILIFLLPFITGYYYSILKNPVLQFSVLLFSFPFLLLFIFSFIPDTVSKKLFAGLLMLVSFAGTASTVIEKKYYSTQHFGVFKEIAEDIVATDNQIGGSSITYAINVSSPYYIDYYLNKFNHPVKADLYAMKNEADFAQLYDVVQQSKTPYFLYAFSNTYNDPEIEQIIRTHYSIELTKKNYFNSGFRLFKKDSSGSYQKTLFEFNHDFETNKLENDSLFKTKDGVYNGNYSSSVDDLHEYSVSFQSTLREINYIDSCCLTISAFVNLAQMDSKIKLVVSIDENNSTVFWRGKSLKDFFKKSGEWKPVFAAWLLPAGLNKNAVIKIYFWNEGKEKVLFDNWEIKLIPFTP